MAKSKEVKRAEAKERQDYWNKLSIDEQINQIKKINPKCKQLKKLQLKKEKLNNK